MNITDVYKELIFYLLIPLFVTILIFGVFLLYVIIQDKKHEDPNKTFKINYWSSIVGIIFGAIIFSASFGFSASFLERIYTYNNFGEYNILLLGGLYIFPIIPLVFVIWCIVKLIKTLKKKNEIIVEVE